MHSQRLEDLDKPNHTSSLTQKLPIEYLESRYLLRLFPAVVKSTQPEWDILTLGLKIYRFFPSSHDRKQVNKNLFVIVGNKDVVVSAAITSQVRENQYNTVLKIIRVEIRQAQKFIIETSDTEPIISTINSQFDAWYAKTNVVKDMKMPAGIFSEDV